jgi:outer membrane protein OmpA-like peptidoglycan-associated protein
MKATKITTLLVVALALTMAGTGCKRKPVNVTDLKNKQYRVGENPNGSEGFKLPGDAPVIGDPNEPGVKQSTKFANPEDFNQDRGTFAANTVHFEYDSSVVKSSEQSNLDAVAAYMKGNSSIGLLVEGHCDERGTEDYNNSLGERRSTALREALIGMGVNAENVITRSFGEYKPVSPGQDESAYKQNRRGEFVVLTPK